MARFPEINGGSLKGIALVAVAILASQTASKVAADVANRLKPKLHCNLTTTQIDAGDPVGATFSDNSSLTCSVIKEMIRA